MAPPSADLSLQERLLKMAKTLQFAWFTGHVVLILCIFRYTLSYVFFNWYSGTAQFTYRLTFIAAAVTYGIVVYKTWRARQKTNQKQPSLLGYLEDENIQYLLMALVWLFMPMYGFAVLPYGIYSIFHVATYTRTNILPAVVPPKLIVPPAGTSPSGKPQYAQHPVADAIGSFVKNYYQASMTAVALLEVGLWFMVALSALLFRPRSWILLVIYTAFVRVRYTKSLHVQDTFTHLEARVDNFMGAQGIPPAVRQVWEAVKGMVRQFHGVTDVNKYVSGASAPAPKKSE